jgi:ABC-type branched-subunit amino acid transport system permease subunit
VSFVPLELAIPPVARRSVGASALRAAAALAPALLLGMAALAAIAVRDLFLAQAVTDAMLLVLYVVSWDLYCGPSRDVSFGHGLFIGAAAYGSALLSARGGLPAWAAVVTGAAVAGVLGALVGALTLRLRGAYFAMLTMAAQIMLGRTLYLFSGTFGGGEGVIGIPPLTADPFRTAAACVGLGIAACAGAVAFRRSRAALLLRAAGADEALARASGVRVWRTRTLAFALSAALAGLAGALHAQALGQVTAELAGEWISSVVALLGLIGARHGVAGVAWAAVGYAALQQLLVPLGGYDAVLVAAVFLGWIWRRTATGSTPGVAAAA